MDLAADAEECVLVSVRADDPDSNRLAHYWQEQGLKRGDVVAMVMPNKPTFIEIWLSFMAIGVTPAFINVRCAVLCAADCDSTICRATL